MKRLVLQWIALCALLVSGAHAAPQSELDARATGAYRAEDYAATSIIDTESGEELVHEGRIVAAGSLADQGRLADAIRLLEKGWKTPKHPKDHHLRRAYALADLLERAGSVPKARQLFGWLARVAPGFADVDARLDALG